VNGSSTLGSRLQALPSLDLIPYSEPLKDPDALGLCFDVSRDLPYDYATLLENILDPRQAPHTAY
jgi:hypothetical protein